MMPLYVKKEQCCGCTACYSVCPVSAVIMREDEEGFLYPEIDRHICTDCGLCKKVCAYQNGYDYTSSFGVPIVYAAKHKQEDVLMNSSSGGMFTALSDYVLGLNGAVYGAAFDADFNTVHIRAVTSENRDLCRGSKYTQSVLGDTYKSVRNDLEAGQYVLFTGTPCQTAGLLTFLRDVNTEKLFTVDLICHGTPSSMLFKEYIAYCGRKRNSKVVEYYHRGKYNGWNGTSKIVYENGISDYTSLLSQGWNSLYSRILMNRPSCYHCKYASLVRSSNITIGDYWGIQESIPDFMDKLGISLVLLNNAKGVEFFNKINGKLKLRESSAYECNNKHQPNLREPSQPRGDREVFWAMYRSKGFGQIAKKYANMNFKAKLKRIIKSTLKKFGLLEAVKALKK